MDTKTFGIKIGFSNLKGYLAAMLWFSIESRLISEVRFIIQSHRIHFITDMAVSPNIEMCEFRLHFTPETDEHLVKIQAVVTEVEVLISNTLMHLGFPGMTIKLIEMSEHAKLHSIYV